MNEKFKHLIKGTWQERVAQVLKYHSSRLRENPDHTIVETAQELDYSIGRISEYLTLAKWMLTHPRVEKFKNSHQALGYIKDKKREMEQNADL